MQNLENLLASIKDVKIKYDNENEKNKFNVFDALHKRTDEVNLHSRFISYLICPKSKHGQKKFFLEIFVRDVLKLNENEFDLSNCQIFPNEEKKIEFKEIDILIINKLKKQAIIIENKIYANDSNKIEERKKYDGYDGQLERYFNTINTGIDVHGKINNDFKCNTVYVYYLSIDKKPSDESLGILKNEPFNKSWKGEIYYGVEIINWLEKCIQVRLDENQFVKEFIIQYLKIIKEMTNNDITTDEKLELKDKISNNWQGAKFLIENFKHVKWHTTHEFWLYLIKEMKNKEFENVRLYQDYNESFEKLITDITHKNKFFNYGIKFNFKNKREGYISGFGNLSWGLLATQTENKLFKNEFEEDFFNEINFSNFNSENTFRLIDQKNMERFVKLFVENIINEEVNNFDALISE
ncbi:PD-(D/E)XK nuclease family protein [Flavobacterium flavipallidum]|uniref:PD-(D/E)XK nuclease family protein n=1 Tax=Flavobacterium flavipallidum TaxID=3139140 RepID=A0ABU9HRK5_9FLAO